MEHIGKRMDVLSSVVTVAAKVFGWDKEENRPSTAINIALLAPSSAQPETGDGVQVIDIEASLKRETKLIVPNVPAGSDGDVVDKP